MCQPLSPRKQIDTNFGCKALSFQLTSIVSLLNLSSCDSNILKVNISDVYEREVRNRESNDHTVCLNCCVAEFTCYNFKFSLRRQLEFSHRRSTIWKINTSNASEGRLSSRHNLPVKAKEVSHVNPVVTLSDKYKHVNYFIAEFILFVY